MPKRILFPMITLIVLLGVLASSSASADIRWKIYFRLDTGRYTSLGASDGNYGSTPRLAETSVNIGVGENGRFEGILYQGGLSSFSETIRIWSTPSAPTRFTLSWKTMVWDPIWFWKDGPLPSPVEAYGKLYSPTGQLLANIDFAQPGGSSNLTSVVSTPTTGYRLDVMANPVPEPSCLLALGAGLSTLVGFTHRKR